MVYEIPFWTLGFLGASYALPYCIPSIRLSLRQINTAIKTNTVFTSECINDIQQGQLDAIDRTMGQLMSAMIQSIIITWAFLNLLTAGSIDPLHNFVISYYIYDMIHLYMKPYGKTQQIFFFHHSMGIFLIVYLQYTGLQYAELMHISYICMELSACSINILHLLRYAYPASKIHIVMSGVNLFLYGFLRLIVYGIALLYFTVTTDITYVYYIPTILQYILYFASLYWFILMTQKHKKLEQKTIL